MVSKPIGKIACLAVVLVLVCVLSTSMGGQSSKKRLSIEGRAKVTGVLVKIDTTKHEITVKNKQGEEFTRSIDPKMLGALKRLKNGATILLAQRDDGGAVRVDDACWRIGNSACGGSQNDPCDSPDERRIYYKCVDEDGNVIYYDDCESDGCSKRRAPTH